LNDVVQNGSPSDEPNASDDSKSPRSRAVIDVSYSRLRDRPALLEEKLIQSPGIVKAEINVFSNRIKVEFDPLLTTIEEIRRAIKAMEESSS